MWKAGGDRLSSSYVKQPEIEHRMRAEDFEKWLAASPKSPAVMALKRQLTQLLGCQIT
jgi:hypothetical protein